MTGGVFLDSGIFIAFLNRRDRWHAQAVALFGGTRPRWGTSLLVVSETYSWFLHRMGEEAARASTRMLHNLEGLRLFEATRRNHEDTLRMLARLRGAKLTYVDASSLVLIEQHGIDQVWSTDRHLALTGCEIVPRS